MAIEVKVTDTLRIQGQGYSGDVTVEISGASHLAKITATFPAASGAETKDALRVRAVEQVLAEILGIRDALRAKKDELAPPTRSQS